MVLESTMILLDNSEFMRNGDYVPSRLEAQHDAANLLVSAKTQSNPENTVGVLTTVDAELLVSPTDDMGKILSALHGVPVRSGSYCAKNTVNKNIVSGIGPTSKNMSGTITAAIQVAHLALKHRRNKNGGQRVVVFVGSPVMAETKALTKMGKQLKKNNVSVDVILMLGNDAGDDADDSSRQQSELKMKELVKAASNAAQDNCHLVVIPPGVLPGDVLVGSPILHGAGAGGASGMGGNVASASGAGGASAGVGGFAEYGGVDPELDPELAMALRVSMEEERARQERAAAAAASGDGSNNNATSNAGGGAPDTNASGEDHMQVDAAGGNMDDGMSGLDAAANDEELLLQQALAMSMQDHHMESSSSDGNNLGNDTKAEGGSEGNEDEEEDEEAAMQRALQMSMQEDVLDGGNATTEKTGEEGTNKFQDPAFVHQLLGSLPGVDPNDPMIREAVESHLNVSDANDDEQKKNEKSEKKDDNEKK
eukprot:CAMPEP_0116066820 /NCGR_PEP_ID=MMETSP0322-20121206/10624_1 /TAXON_ID=163516 /ORGANISM="Leptocylindrus danicus var. apora, Strain B651" /LENGTH=480 /DNA_ID=CAMNT_0003553475 /DNA_START=73 /DNA_END=1515 /DNA_ORIENTATION=-